jgi:hypothetical protein
LLESLRLAALSNIVHIIALVLLRRIDSVLLLNYLGESRLHLLLSWFEVCLIVGVFEYGILVNAAIVLRLELIVVRSVSRMEDSAVFSFT